MNRYYLCVPKYRWWGHINIIKKSVRVIVHTRDLLYLGQVLDSGPAPLDASGVKNFMAIGGQELPSHETSEGMKYIIKNSQITCEF